MIVPHAANIGVPPQWKDLTNDSHPPQRAVNQLHYVCIAHLLKMDMTEMFYFHLLSLETVTVSAKNYQTGIVRQRVTMTL